MPAVPLLIGHGGNTGSQSNATVIRALALGHLRPSDWARVMWKECAAGALMGGALGGAILTCSLLWGGLSVEVRWGGRVRGLGGRRLR